MTAPLDIDRIEGLAAAASPGPWHVDYECDGPLVGSMIEAECWVSDAEWNALADENGNCSEADAAFIASARSDVPALVAEVKRLREALTKPVTSGEFEAAYLNMFELAHGDEETGDMPTAMDAPNARGAAICQIIMRRRAVLGE